MRITSSIPTKSMLPLIIRIKPSLFESHRSKYGLFVGCTSSSMLPILQLKPCSSRARTSALSWNSGIYSPSYWQLLFVFQQQFDNVPSSKPVTSFMFELFPIFPFLHPASARNLKCTQG